MACSYDIGKYLLFFIVFQVCVECNPKKLIPFNEEETAPHKIQFSFVELENRNLRFANLLDQPTIRKPVATESDVNFYLFTKEAPDKGSIIRATNFSEIYRNKFFKKDTLCKFTVHGWLNGINSRFNSQIRKAVLENHDINLIAVDWSNPASNWKYWSSKDATFIVGRIVGNFINFLIEEFDYHPRNFSVVGMSLGAHIAGFAGREVKQKHGLIDHIVALDAASPFYTLKDNTSRIDKGDAVYVHVIHTNGAFLGFRSSLGTADYYPNGGEKQVGCGWDLVGMCSHNRAADIYAESLRNPNFIAYNCANIKEFEKNQCFNNHRSWMGGFNIDKSASGDYYLKTAEHSPFSLGDPKI